MYTTYHLKSAQEITVEIIEAIKIAYQSKPICITIEEEIDETSYLMRSEANRKLLLQSIQEDKAGSSISVKLPA